MFIRDDGVVVLTGNYDHDGWGWVGEIPAELMKGDTITVRVCDHERRNDHGDACLDCYACEIDGKWE
jgi:hypothetical protein